MGFSHDYIILNGGGYTHSSNKILLNSNLINQYLSFYLNNDFLPTTLQIGHTLGLCCLAGQCSLPK